MSGKAKPKSTEEPRKPRVLAHIPEELARARLHRLGEGIGKVVYASEHWVVKRQRSPSEVVALIILWRILRRIAHLLPGHLGDNRLRRPSRLIRFLRVVMQAVMLIVPRSIWLTTHIAAVWKGYRRRDLRGERLANTHLAGTTLIPQQIVFPPARVKVGGWPGWLTVHEATERVDATLHHRLEELAESGRFTELERWLDRFLDLRQSGWQRGLFSLDAHLQNFGVCGDRIVLLDAGGLTNDWSEIENRLSHEEVVDEPHRQLGLGPVLSSRPDIAERFNARWKSIVNLARVREHWPESRVS